MSSFESFIQPHADKSDDFARGAALAWQHRQNEVDELKEQLRNMEQCYIAMKQDRSTLFTLLIAVRDDLKQAGLHTKIPGLFREVDNVVRG